ncbi:DUF4377 domain-containing protein [Christiangramia crocea]|uniref:DUF4377 domain-containing protein n=1 Tax=Christiangramia crocea TaxID=2904124 RepID=A0A9X1UYR1_9FLAO|nr:DUF4377 domain-containing protein [Gramella crocea]MCG9972666.1 DUF4377 domain-containing protein [Gramella crocea]
MIDVNADFENLDMRINHFKQTGVGEALQLVYLVQEDEAIGGEKWTYMYDEILGFEYEPGYIYDLKVRKETVENPPQDASSARYILISVRSKQKAPEGENFKIYLKSFGENFVTKSGDELYLLNEYKIDCGSICETLSEDLETQENVTGSFTHGPNESLLLQSISYESKF